ncbi:MAG: amphi-Trp domain-containing protein, partial [Candidatus Promineifilaceae bacterium]|nr:amphi-Trp domain-containing protein [Candidatus Promineifilaceae bacterium]
MSREVVLFASEERQPRSSVAEFLRQLADRVEAGEVLLQKGTESLTLQIPTNTVLEVKAEEEDKQGRMKRSLEVEIEWMEGEDEGTLSL